MPRKPGPPNLQGRLRAFEMFSAGMRKADIARELQVTRACINDWRKKDLWEERLGAAVAGANAAVDHALGNEIAEVLAVLRTKLKLRISQLEQLCNSPRDGTKLRAILAWFQLAGIKQGIPNPTDTKGPANLQLIQDLVETHETTRLLEGIPS